MPAMLLCVCTCSDSTPSLVHVLNGVTAKVMVPNRLTSTCYYHAYKKKKPVTILINFISSNNISIPNMKNTTKKKTSTTSPLAKVGKKKKKAESPITSKVGTTMSANQNGGRVGKTTTTAESPKKTSVETPKKVEENGKGSGKGILGTKAGKSTNTR